MVALRRRLPCRLPVGAVAVRLARRDESRSSRRRTRVWAQLLRRCRDLERQQAPLAAAAGASRLAQGLPPRPLLLRRGAAARRLPVCPKTCGC